MNQSTEVAIPDTAAERAPEQPELKPEVGQQYCFKQTTEMPVSGDVACRANDSSRHTFRQGKSFTLMGISLPPDYSPENPKRIYKLGAAEFITATPAEFAALVGREKRFKEGGKRKFGESPKFRASDEYKYKIRMILDELEVSEEVRRKAASMAETLKEPPQEVSFDSLSFGQPFRVRTQRYVDPATTARCAVYFEPGALLSLANATSTRALLGKEDISLTLRGRGTAQSDREFPIDIVDREFTLKLSGCQLPANIRCDIRDDESNFAGLSPKRAACLMTGRGAIRSSATDADLYAALKAAAPVVEAAEYTMPANTTNNGRRSPR